MFQGYVGIFLEISKDSKWKLDGRSFKLEMKIRLKHHLSACPYPNFNEIYRGWHSS